MNRAVKGMRGSGSFLVIVVTLVLLAAFLGIYQMTFSRHVVSHVNRAALGEVAMLLAESTVQEMLTDIRKRVNDPADELFNTFRKEVLKTSENSFTIDVKTPVVTKLLAQKEYEGYSLQEATAKVTFQRLFSKLPYEKYGVISCTATVGKRLGLTYSVSRTLKSACEFKVALLAPPRPFDQISFMVTDTNYLIQGANFKIRESIRELIDAKKLRNEVIEQLKNAGKDYSLLKKIKILSRKKLKKRFHLFKEPLTIFSVKPVVDLEKVDLPRRLSKTTSSIKKIAKRYIRASSLVKANATSDAAIASFADALKDWVKAHQKRLNAVRSFQSTFVEYSGKARDRFAKFFFKLEQREWQAKAFYRIGGSNINGQLAALRAKVKPLNGVIYIDNPEESLNLEGSKGKFDGRLVIVTTGNVVIGDVPSSTGLLTVISFGNLSVVGDCRASLVANQRISVSSNATVLGNVILREVRSFGALKGKVNYDRTMHSGRTKVGDSTGAFWDYYYVAIGPGETIQGVTR